MKIYADVTETHVNKLRTGIQRVVREVVGHAKNVGSRVGAEVVPVVAGSLGFFHLENSQKLLVLPTPEERPKGIGPVTGGAAIRFLKRLLRGFPRLHRLGSAVLYRIRSIRDDLAWKRRVKVLMESGDTLLLLDSYWGRGGAHSLAAAMHAKRQGVSVIAVVYDLIPVTHPQYYDDPLVIDFKRALNVVARVSEGIVCISNAVSEELVRHLGEDVAPKQIDYFHLGADFHGGGSDITVSATQWPAGLWVDGVPVFIMVGTIEPRKGHAFVLDAFEAAWRKGYAGKLLIVGKVGWKTDELVKRIRSSSEFGGRLFMLNEADDQMLGEAYRRAHACIIASYVEGFGLPLVEALQRGIPVLASDIPVFREIAGEHAIYFSHETPDTLVQAINTLEGGYSAQVEKLKKFRWLTWEESTEQLLTKVVQMAASINSTQSGTHSH